MSVRPDFESITVTKLRAYVLEHRDEEEALHAYLDKLHAQKRDLRVYKPEDNVADAIAQYLKSK